MRRLNVYFVHSTKFDYNNLLYKKVLSSSICLSHNMILPRTKEYQDKYTKDLMNKADVIIVEVSSPSFGLWLELKYLMEINKPKLFLSLDNEIPAKLKRYVPTIKITDGKTYLKEIENFIVEHAKDIKEEKDENDTSVTLGEL